MLIDITPDTKYLYITSENIQELILLKRDFTREVNNAWLLRKKSQFIVTERLFFSDFGYMPTGLWLDLLQWCKKNSINPNMSIPFQNYIKQFGELKFDSFKEYIDDIFKNATNDKGGKFAPYNYQIEATWNLLRYKKSTAEISTSAGKTLISFMLFKYLIDKVPTMKKILYIVPSVDLATQSAEKFDIYERNLNADEKQNWSTGVLKGSMTAFMKRQVECCNILFATYQSLSKKEDEFFLDFTAIINDECHHSGSAQSIQKIIEKCVNAEYSIGVTGTYPKFNTIENFNIKSYMGPQVYTLTADSLINEEKQATPIYIVFQIMDWATKDEKQMLWEARNIKSQGAANIDYTIGTKLLNHEMKYINTSGKRMKYIADLAIKQAKNCLVLFGDIKGGYGKRIADYIKEYSDKNVHYIDGSTSSNDRELYKKMCEEDTTGKTVLVASVGTFGEGIDICNIWSILLVNSAKSERIIRQICGRGFRRYPGKDKTIIFDFVDDLRYTETGKYNDNYIWTHYKERKKIYKEQNFPVYEQSINLSDNVFGFS